MIIKEEAMFNESTLNIFTDASIVKTPHGEVVGCAGANVIIGKTVVGQYTRIIRHSTSNNSEINAVKLGIECALNFRANNSNIKVINLISDSKLCIFSLREWIFSWVKNSLNKDYLVGSTGQKVINQEVMLDIIYKILDNNLSINLYHQNGHINANNEAQLLSAKKTFIESNFLQNDVDINLIKSISIANDEVDKFTKEVLKNNIFLPTDVCATPMLNYIYVPFDIGKYIKLLNIWRY